MLPNSDASRRLPTGVDTCDPSIGDACRLDGGDVERADAEDPLV